MKDQDIAIKITNLSKKYVIRHEKPTFTERVLQGRYDEFYALKNINLTIKRGERLAFIGANGCGKTTLLKIIAGISTPTSGIIKVNGKVVSLIDLEAGFHPDLTGLQNIHLNGLILGIPKKKIMANMDKIVKFTDIDRFIDSPLFTYSQGMKLRLGFSVAIHSEPEILVLDENLAVGDENFRKNSVAKIKEMFKTKKTIILASHNLEFIKNNSDKTVWLEKGKIKLYGKTSDVLKKYYKQQN